MPAGFEVIGSHGVYQIDDTYNNLVLRAKGTFDGSYTTIGVPNAVTPIIAGRNAQSGIGFLPAGLTWSGSTATFGMRTTPTTGEYFIFDQPLAGVENYGMEIYNSAGVKKFDSEFNYMKVVGQYAAGAGPAEPSGKKYAWAQVDSGYYETAGSPPSINQWSYAMYMNASKIVVAGSSYQMGIRSGTVTVPFPGRSPKLLLLDVTGL